MPIRAKITASSSEHAEGEAEQPPVPVDLGEQAEEHRERVRKKPMFRAAKATSAE